MCPESLWQLHQGFPLRLEAEDAQPHGDNRTFDGTSSAGAYVAAPTTYLLYRDLYIPATGDYQLEICHRGPRMARYAIIVNGEQQTVILPASSDAWSTTQATLHFEAGFNTVRLSPVTTSNLPDIDYVELSRIGDDTAIRGVTTAADGVLPRLTVHTLTDGSGVQCSVSGCERGILRLYNANGTECAMLRYPEFDTFATTQLPEGVYVVCLTSYTGQHLASCKISIR